MKTIITNYYNFKNILELKKDNNIYYFNYNNNIYKFELLYSIEGIDIIYKISNNGLYDQIIPNIYNKIYTVVDNKYYVLLRKRNYNNINIYNDLLNNNYVFPNTKILNMSNWVDLWSMKVDYYEYQQKHIVKYDLILESFNYYLGMAENAISYIKNNISNNYAPIVISHRRIKEDNYYDPLNIVFDYRARDVAEYLKFLFFKKGNIDFNINEFLYKLNFSKDEYILLYSRLIYPSYYFDLYDNILFDKTKEKELSLLITRINEYEKFLNNIYYNINRIIAIPQITWI